MTVTARALTARRRSLREVMKLETAVVDHVSTMRRLVTCKINNDADMSPVGLLLLVSRDGSRKEVDCDPRIGLVRILSSTRGGILCYAQALGVVDVGSLSVELSWRIKVRSGRPSCRASQGQNHGVRRGYGVSGEVRQSA